MKNIDPENVTIEDLSKYINEIEIILSSIISGEIGEIKLPNEIELYSLDIPLINVTRLGDNFKRYCIGRPIFDFNFKIERTLF